ncbi:MAG: hypothetical protein KC466_09420 [Myxococcales bacterium]|nr:hypothetical protein [Myxococcales bacterium]
MCRLFAAVAFVVAVPAAARAATCPLTVGDAVSALKGARQGQAPVPTAPKILDVVVTLGNTGDFDADGLTNCVDVLAGADPRLADTDRDGLSDAEEVNTTHTDPANGDSDHDGFGDKDELDAGSNPRNVNSVPVNLHEQFVFSATESLVSIQNATPQLGVVTPFGLFGVVESNLTSVMNLAPPPAAIAPFKVFGGAESPLVSVQNNTPPPAAVPPYAVFGSAETALVSIRNDSAGGLKVNAYLAFGRIDGALFSVQNNAVFGIAKLSCTEDSDGDGLSNCVEFLLGLRPDNSDSDGNGVLDGDEDTDGDGLTNLQEIALGTFAMVADSDGDGFSDGDEARMGSDPMDVASLPIDPSASDGYAESAVTSVNNPSADPGS